MTSQPQKFTHFIFDLDGTLIDTEQSVLETWQKTLKLFVPNRDFSMEQLRIVLGITTEKALEKLDVSVPGEFESQWAVLYRESAHSISFFDGIPEMLKRLKEKGCDVGIVSSRSRQEYEDYFTCFGLNSLCPAVVLKEDTQKHKPDAQPIVKYLELTKADSAQCIYIGDMSTDVECAKNAGIASGLAAWQQNNRNKGDADFVFASPADILKIKK